MAIVFPASPSVNDTFTEGSITYKWDGAKWIGLGITPADRLIEGSNSLEITAGNDLVWTGDNVGIGTDNPGYKLHIGDGTSQANVRLQSGDSDISLLSMIGGTSQTCRIEFGDSGDDDIGKIYYDNSDNSMQFTTNTAERLRIDNSGNLNLVSSSSTLTDLNFTENQLNVYARIEGGKSGSGVGDLRFHTYSGGLAEALRITSGGQLLVGHETSSNLAGGFSKALAIEGTGAANSSIGIVRNANDDNPPYIYLGKSRGSSPGANNVISNGDTIGMVNFAGAKGSGFFGDAVNLRANADNSFTGTSSPGRFSVWTTPVNSTSPLEGFQVNSAGAITAPRNVAWSYRRVNTSSWGSASGLTYSNLDYRAPIPLFGNTATSTDYDTHSALSTFSIGGGTGMKFTAPVAGKYMVTLNMSSVTNNVDDDWGSIGLMVNTVSSFNTGSIDYMLDTNYFPDTTSTGNQFGWGGSVIINLSQNDYIVPYSMSVQNFSSDNQFFFQGYLLG
jgi:hypothetical protein